MLNKKDKMVYRLEKYYLPFHIRIVYHGKRAKKNGYTLIDFTFYEYSKKVLRKWAIDLIIFNRYFEINKER
jgi:hypothetical protein